MKTLLRLEEAAMLILSIILFSQTDFSWWWFPALILVPDIGMAGYAVNPKVGAVTYNLFHHKAIAVAAFIVGFIWGLPVLELTGIILFGHASMDRIFGYGLKYCDSFKNTHIGKI
ncbi:MAG TPA: DUF4260 domain-containing protein [Fodinibius sp.]|nr:DUF4260 domain-containing protein [Fodinibius sp.]